MDYRILPVAKYRATNMHAKERQYDKKNNTTSVLWDFSKKYNKNKIPKSNL